jgi:hypothetical protein
MTDDELLAPAGGDTFWSTRGDEALVATMGTLCAHPQKPQCNSNSDPAAILSGGKSFGTLWSEQVEGGAANDVYMLAPCVKVGGSWYLYEPPGARFGLGP